MRSISSRSLLFGSVLVGVFLRFYLADTRPGLNGDEVLFAVEWSSFFSGQESNLLTTPSGRPTELLNLFIGLCTYLLSFLTKSLWAVRLPNLILSTLFIYLSWLFSRRFFDQTFSTIFTVFVALCPALLAIARVSIGAELIPFFSLAQLYLSWTRRPWLLLISFIPSLLYHPTTVFGIPFYLVLLTRTSDLTAFFKQCRKSLLSATPFLVLVSILIAVFLSNYPPVTRLLYGLIHDLKVLLHPSNLESNAIALYAYLCHKTSPAVILGPIRLFSGLLYFRHIGSIDDSFDASPILLASGLLLVIPALLAFVYRVNSLGLLSRIYTGLALSIYLLVHTSGAVGFADHTYRWSTWLIVPILFATSFASSEVYRLIQPLKLRKASVYLFLTLFSFLAINFYSYGIVFARSTSDSPVNPIYVPAQRGTIYEQIFSNLIALKPKSQDQALNAFTDDYFIYYPLRYYQMHSGIASLKLSIYRNDLLDSAEGRAERENLLDITLMKKMLDDSSVWIAWSHSPVFTHLRALTDRHPDKYHSYCSVSLFGQSNICLFVSSD